MGGTTSPFKIFYISDMSYAAMQRCGPVPDPAPCRALPGPKLDIRLDRLDDPYGSPSIDDIEKFCRQVARGWGLAAMKSPNLSHPGSRQVWAWSLAFGCRGLRVAGGQGRSARIFSLYLEAVFGGSGFLMAQTAH